MRGGLGCPFSARCWPPVPRLWPGSTCVILGGGPSLTREQADYARARAKVIAVNNAWELGADLLYACDWKWWATYRPAFRGLKVTQDARVTYPGVVRVPSVTAPGLSLDPLRTHQGMNGGYQAINLAVLLGASRIVLLGFDMRAIDGRRHWHPDHPPGMNNPPFERFQVWLRQFRTMLPDLKRAGVEVVNATPGSALDCFPMAPLEAAL